MKEKEKKEVKKPKKTTKKPKVDKDKKFKLDVKHNGFKDVLDGFVKVKKD